MCGTLWLAMFLYNFRKTPYLTRARRELLADYALPASVLVMSFAGAYVFSDIDSTFMFRLYKCCMHRPSPTLFFRGHVQNEAGSPPHSATGTVVPVGSGHLRVLPARLLPILPLLHGPEHHKRHREQLAEQVSTRARLAASATSCFRLKKGTAIHLDMLVVAFLNMALSLFGLPWMHGALPHSPLHIRALADVEERVAQGHVHEV